MVDYFYTEEEEKRLLEIITEIEEHPYFEKHFTLPLEQKLEVRFRMLQSIRLEGLAEEKYAHKRFRDKYLKADYKGEDITAAIAEMLFIAEKQGYTYSLAKSDSFSKRFTGEQSFLNYMLDDDELTDNAIKSVSERAENAEELWQREYWKGVLDRAIQNKLNKREVIPVAELHKSGYFVYMFNDSQVMGFSFVRKNPFEYVLICDEFWFADVAKDQRIELKKFLNL